MVSVVEKSSRNISIIIPNWNGKDLLEKYLPSVIRAVNFYKGNTEIIVVDDGSTDGSVKFLHKKYPEMKTIGLRNNRGFAEACNVGLKHCSYDIIIFLNNDMMVSEDFLLPLSEHFNDEQIFGVRLGIRWLTKDEIATDISHFFLGINFRFGFIECPMLRLKEPINPFYCAYVSGGAGAFDRNKLLQLRGFDQMFSPFYWEDVDLSYRAWKRNWKTVFEPKSMVYHQPHSTIFRYKKQNFIQKVSERNKYLLVWKNIHDHWLMIKHLFFIPCRLFRNLCTGNLPCFLAFFDALKYLPEVYEKRKMERQNSLVQDREIFMLFEGIARKADIFFGKT